MNDQRELDQLFGKIAVNYKSVTDKELTRLVQLINYKYSGNDLILNLLQKSQLIKSTDHITRATYELTKRKGIVDTSSKHYILTNLYKARIGLESTSRKELFIEHNLVVEDEIHFRGTYIRFKFCVFEGETTLLLKHIYGFRSITNFIEQILKEIELSYLNDVGFSIIRDNISIFYRDIIIDGVPIEYCKVTLKEGLKNPEWTLIDSSWYEDIWDSIGENESYIEEPVFLEKNQQYTGYKKVKEIFKTAKKSILLIDPYIDNTLFTLSEEIDTKIKINVITEKFQGDSKLVYDKYKKEHNNIEIHATKGNHDRFVIVDDKWVYLFGSSINSLGNKATTIIPIESELIRNNIMSYYNEAWQRI
ncbi:hypothetical protein [Mesobacillus selenatarsenatis]|uniref:Putative DNA-binding protein n=1 Tax=Mesobacillus selenatarsenatis (strain DSM 18680 / JCM 14380 / FERM P-15431 / SF-1) TaxID=1321606 RepID=A0A0A8X0Y0_MESS1|nr:hypothetical protein [Mesobacillus selenatarsenatis]GAM12869.1 putative DNA-binding protein [Mesobacillus selenatarsenatis SF-1]